MVKEKQKKHGRLRKAVQAAAGFLQNPRWLGIGKGNLIYNGPLKNVCVPGMNCYSCPAAIGACPIGGMQAVFGSRKKFPFYVLGYLALLGILLGRFVCGWLCLFGLVQELLYKIPVPKLTVPKKLDRGLRWLKYTDASLTLMSAASAASRLYVSAGTPASILFSLMSSKTCCSKA